MEPAQDKNSKLRSQIQTLRSGNHSAILTTLKDLRSQGNVSILPDLFELLLDQENELIVAEITSLLSDLKDQDAVEVLAGAIGNPEFRNIQAPLVASCWQNGLSYGKFTDIFIDVVITGGYEAAIEAFTVIEEVVGDLDQDQRDRAVKTLKYRLSDKEELKKPLLSELVKVIQTY